MKLGHRWTILYFTSTKNFDLEILQAHQFELENNHPLNHTLYIYIYIYSHPQTDCFVVSQLFTVTKHIKLGSKHDRLYGSWISYLRAIVILIVSKGIFRVHIFTRLDREVAGISLHVNAHKTECMCFNQRCDISTLNGSSLKLVDRFTYQGSSVSSTEAKINTQQAKTWTAIDRLSVIWKSDLTDKMKCSFFQAAVDTAIWMHYMDAN